MGEPHGENLIVIIGRGNSGTRMLSHALMASGVYMGNRLNESGDKLPPEQMYEACRLIGRHVRWSGGLEWDFEPLHSMPIDGQFEELVREYLSDVLAARHPQARKRQFSALAQGERRGWKLPETTLAFPWIARMFPEARYVHVVRDPRDSLRRPHLTDDLRRANVSCPEMRERLEQRVASWKYQYEVVMNTPSPKRFATIRYEDFVLEHERTMRELEGFLGIPLARVVVRPERVGQWKVEEELCPYIGPLEDAMRECGYAAEFGDRGRAALA